MLMTFPAAGKAEIDNKTACQLCTIKRKINPPMKTRVMVYSLLLPAISANPLAPVLAADIEHGKALLEQHCTRCHDTRVFTRPDHRIHTLEALKGQVERCEANAHVHWPQSDFDDVVAYLNAAFYKFGDAADGAQK